MIGSILFATYGLICLYKNFGKQNDDDSETPLTDENGHSLTENYENGHSLTENEDSIVNAQNDHCPAAVQSYDNLNLKAKHPVQALSELTQKLKLPYAQYDVMEREENMAFMKVTAAGHIAIGQAPKLKMAKVEAARALLSQMGIHL